MKEFTLYYDVDSLFYLQTGLYRYSKTMVNQLSKTHALHFISLTGKFICKEKWMSSNCKRNVGPYRKTEFLFRSFLKWKRRKKTFMSRACVELLRPLLHIERFFFRQRKFFFKGRAPVLFLPNQPQLKTLCAPYFTDPKVLRVHFIHDVIPLRIENESIRNQQKNIFKSVIDSVDLLLVNSEFTKRDLISFFPQLDESKVVVTLLGCESHFHKAKLPLESKKRYLKNTDSNYILVVSPMCKRKNAELILQAWRELQEEGELNNLELLIIGKKSKWFCEEIEKQNQDLFQTSATACGELDESDLPAIYSGALFSIYASLYEGFGFPILESMRCGTFCLASNATSHPEILGPNLPSFDPHSKEELKMWIKKLLKDNNLRESLAHSAYERSLQFTWERTKEITLNAIEAAIAKKGMDSPSS